MGRAAEDAEALTVVVADRNLAPLQAQLEAGVPPGTQVRWPADEAELLALLPQADVYVGSSFTPDMGAAAGRLRLVHVAAAGYDRVDPAALPPGAVCANTFRHEDSIAEYVAASTVLLRRQLLQQDRELRRAHWTGSRHEPGTPQVSTLAGATVGFVGFGHIGRRTWELLRAFGARGRAVSRRGVDAGTHGLDVAGTIEQLDELLAASDVVVLCLPLTERTRGLIGARELAAMRRQAILVNVSRGPIVEEAALYDALERGEIGGAALDVWYRYPAGSATTRPADAPFHRLRNVLMTPHVSGVTRQTFEGRAADITANIRRLATGGPLQNVVLRG